MAKHRWWALERRHGHRSHRGPVASVLTPLVALSLGPAFHVLSMAIIGFSSGGIEDPADDSDEEDQA